MTCKNLWLPTIQKRTTLNTTRLFCLPFAGGSSFAYRSFEPHISPEIEMHTIELPGRGTRADEAFCEHIEQLIPNIAEAIRPHLDTPFAFFGHSMGALIAFELACYLESHDQKKADYLFLSAMQAPHLASRFPAMSLLPNEDLLHWIRKLEELPESILKSPERLSLFLKIMQADFALCKTCAIPISAYTTIPIIAFSGSEDEFAPEDDVRRWVHYTKSHFRFEIFNGGHFFFKTSGKELAQAINTTVNIPRTVTKFEKCQGGALQFEPGEAGAEAAKLKKFSDAGGSQIQWLPDAGRFKLCERSRYKSSGDKSIELNGCQLTLDQLTSAAAGNLKISITKNPAVLARVQSSFQKMQQSVASGETIYGVTTSFGSMANRPIDCQEAAHMQQNMLWVHKTGAGGYLPKEDVRAAMILRANSHLRGNSSIRLSLIERLITFVNEGVTPCVPELGSIGASGDLVPLAYIAGALIGHEADYQVEMDGKIFSASIALKKLNFSPLSFEPKEALAMLNGTSMMTAIGANCAKEAEELLILTLHVQAMLIQGLRGSLLSFHPYLHQMKPHPGQIWVSEKILHLLKGSRLVTQNDGFDRNSKNDLVQDRYSLRCLPQYLGPIFENLWNLKRQLEIEMNSSNDNPLMNPDTGEIFYGGNFLGEYIGIGMDQLRMMLSLTAKSIDVQIALLIEPKFNNGLSSSLIGNPERLTNMGFKALQVVGNSILPLIEFYGHTIADRFPTHAEQFNQNINSQGFNSANLARKSLELFRHYLSLSLLFGVQAIDLRSHKEFGSYEGKMFISLPTQELYLRVREITQRPSESQRPWLWNDGEHKLDEQMSRLNADLASQNSKLKKSFCLD